MKRGFFYYFGLFMVVYFICCGIGLLLFGDKLDFFAQRPVAIRYIAGFMLIAYGMYRLGKIQYQQRNNDDYNEQILDNDEEDEKP